MTYENISGIIGVILQAIVAVIAWKALSVWKSEIRGRDKYKLSKDLLEYIKKIRFLVHTDKGSLHQIYLNDILVNKKEFYKKQLSLIAKEKVYFDENYMNLFDHINIRSNIFLQKEIRIILEELYPSSLKFINKNKNKYTHIQLGIANFKKINNLSDGVYSLNNDENTTIEGYFKKWEKLIKELQRSIYD